MRSKAVSAADRRAFWVPAALSLFFLLLSAALCLLLYRYTLVPNYTLGLLFGVPAVILALAAAWIRRRGGGDADVAACAALSAVCLLLGVFLAGGAIFLGSVQTETADPEKYEKVLELGGYPGDPALGYFPAHIPGDAEHVQFHYLSGFGGTTVALQYGADGKKMAQYEAACARAARWSGSLCDGDAAGYGIYTSSLPFYEGEEDIPADLTLYVLYFKGDEAQALNHGQSCIAAVSQREHEILYLYDKW